MLKISIRKTSLKLQFWNYFHFFPGANELASPLEKHAFEIQTLASYTVTTLHSMLCLFRSCLCHFDNARDACENCVWVPLFPWSLFIRHIPHMTPSQYHYGHDIASHRVWVRYAPFIATNRRRRSVSPRQVGMWTMIRNQDGTVRLVHAGSRMWIMCHVVMDFRWFEDWSFFAKVLYHDLYVVENICSW